MTRELIARISIAALLMPSPAWAYNWKTHSRIAEAAVSVMQQFPGPVDPPPDIDENDWAEFIAAVQAAPGKLGKLRTGLPQSLPREAISLDPTAGGSEPYPINPESEEHGTCNFDRSHNLAAIGKFRIDEFPYLPQRNASGGCGIDWIDQGQQPLVLQRVLGWHAAGIDDHLDDIVVWSRPTNAGALGFALEVASLAFELVVGAITLPFVCLGEAIFGDGCDIDDSFKLADKYNPVDYSEGWLPGFGTIRSDIFTGLWHFVDVNAGEGQYNRVRGMYYPEAGPEESPGAFDIAVMSGTMMAGLSMNAFASDGDDNYGKYDEVQRDFVQWQAHAIGLLEFSPLQNLAQYGWDEYVASGFTDARGLGWPLHALGDATVPHHISGTSSWGHRPYEDYIDNHLDDRLGQLLAEDPNSPGVIGDTAQRQRFVVGAFRWWRQLRDGVSIQRTIIDLARETQLRTQSDWPYDDGASIAYLNPTFKGASIESYAARHANINDLIELSVSATLGFLTHASQLAQDPGADDDRFCPLNSSFSREALQCVPGPPPPGMVPPGPNLGICFVNTSCGAGGSGNGGTGGSGGTGGGGGCIPCSAVTDCGSPGTWRCDNGCCQPIGPF